MPKITLFVLLVMGLATSAACGDKLDPVTDVAEPTATTVTPSASDSNSGTGGGNTVTSGGNTTTTPPSTTQGLCGTNATTISYATHIAPLVSTSCGNCHGSGGTSPTMTSYTNTMSAFTSRGAQSEIDSGVMPQGMTLTANQKCLLDTWATSSAYAP